MFITGTSFRSLCFFRHWSRTGTVCEGGWSLTEDEVLNNQFLRCAYQGRSILQIMLSRPRNQLKKVKV